MFLNSRSAGLFLWVILLFFVGSFNLLYAQSDTLSNRLKPYRLSHDFKITEELKNPAWQHANSVFITHEVQPNDQNLAPVQAQVKVLYSSKYLYIGFIVEDAHPSKIRAHITDRDNISGDDFVGIFLDPFNNNQHAYELFVNPRGIQFDAMRTNNNENSNFDMIWYSKGTVSDSGYTAVMKIPFKSLHFPPQNIQDWAINFIRNYPRSKRYQFAWTNISNDNSCLLCQNGHLVNMTDVKNINTVELIPYALGYQNSALRDAGDGASGLDHGPVKARFGGSISYAPTSTSSLDAVINPDFSQVETDAAQIGVNETFALYYSEKRPFFLKGANLFETGEDLFYSRTINQPLAAGKFTKKAANYSVAFLTAYDRDVPFIVPGLLGSQTVQSNVNAYDNIFRGKLNIGSQSHIGGLISTRNETRAYNYAGSIDWNFFLGGHYYFNGLTAYSTTRELNDTTLFNEQRRFGQSRYDAAFNGQQFRGTFLTAQFERQAKYYDFSVAYKSLSPTFQAQNGFINEIDRRQIELSQDVAYFPDTPWLSRGGLSTSGSWRYDFGGAFQERFIHVVWFNYFAGQTHLSISYLPLNDERFRGEFFTKIYRTSIDLDTQPWDALSLSASLETGRDIYRTRDPELGHGYNFSASATIKPSARLQLDLDYDYSTLSSLDDSRKYYSGNIIRLKGNYNFTRRLFARLITQYDSFSNQIQIYPLLYYKLNAFSKFYIGMTDYVNDFNQTDPRAFNGYRQTNREFFVKIQYLIRN